MSIREYAATLGQVMTTLAAAAASADTALRELTSARAILTRISPDGWCPAELDLAIAELTRVVALAAAARETIADYVTRL
ncbi:MULTISPECIES: hypothetical protein [Actinokineospora]|uniref:hypothetical protein n=1 Tax=Actinokineospora TaxID=39845 RepID=UPI0016705F88|nr:MULTISPECIES: hypothetical protein [Actinokineospora]